MRKIRSIPLHAVSSALFSLTLFTSACGHPASPNTLNNNALPHDTAGTAVGRLKEDAALVSSAYLKSNGSYYHLECSSLVGLEQLIQGVGYPLEKIKDNPVFSYDDFLTQPGNVRDLSLSCDLGRDAHAKLVHLVDSDKYFISYDNGSGKKFLLRMLGCSSLIAALGFDQNHALPITAKNLDIFNTADNLDIHCYAGEKPSPDQAKAPYVARQDKAQLLRIDDAEQGEVLALSNGKNAYQLKCEDDPSSEKRLKAFGFTPAMLPFVTRSAWDSAPVIDTQAWNNPTIHCHDQTAQLKAIDWPDGRRYYLFFNEVKSDAVLHEVGCRELVEFVNPNLLHDVSAIDPETARFFYTFSPVDKFECLRGTPL